MPWQKAGGAGLPAKVYRVCRVGSHLGSESSVPEVWHWRPFLGPFSASDSSFQTAGKIGSCFQLLVLAAQTPSSLLPTKDTSLVRGQ